MNDMLKMWLWFSRTP